MKSPLKKIILSRTDNIGDVVLTLPMAGVIKKYYPNVEILFLGREYVKPVVACSVNIDRFIAYDELEKLSWQARVAALSGYHADAIIHVFPVKEIARLAKAAKIPLRIGTSHRTYHWLTCNKRLSIGRKNSQLHEAQLNLALLTGIGLSPNVLLKDIPAFYGFDSIPTATDKVKTYLSQEKPNIVLHPTSKGSAREWPLDHFNRLLQLIGDDANVIITGSQGDRGYLDAFLNKNKAVIQDTVGKLDLNQLIALLSRSQMIIAASTGPLHIGAALGIHTIGIYPPMRPIHPGRWAPLGKNAGFLVNKKECDDCRNSNLCQCMLNITPEMVMAQIENLL